MRKLYVGIDLALVSKHRASIYDAQKNSYLDNSFSFDCTFGGFEYLLEKCKKHIKKGEEAKINFIMEPTGNAWVPLSCYLIAKGHRVYRVTTQKSHDFRKFLDKHTKSDRIDARALAKLPLVSEDDVYELVLPTHDLGTLSRKAKHMAKLIKETSAHKLRIQSIFDMTNPKVLKAFGEDKFSKAGRIFFKHFSNPLKVVELGKNKFFDEFRKELSSVSDEILEKIYDASGSIIKIYEPLINQGALPFDFYEVDEEIQTELRILEFLEVEIEIIRKHIKVIYKKIDPEGYLMSIRGIGDTIAPAVLGIIGDVDRFPNIGSFRKYFGFISKKKQSSNTDRKGLKIHKAAPKLLKHYLYLAADTARRWDVEFACFYDRLTKKGHHHYKAVCALANKMAGRIYAMLKRMKNAENCNYNVAKVAYSQDRLKPNEVRYKLRNLEGNIISKQEATKIVRENFPSKSKREMSALKAKEKQRESLSSLKPFEGQPRQFFLLDSENSLKRSCKTLPVKDILNDMFSELFLQDNGVDLERKTFYDTLKRLKDQIEEKELVDKLCKGGGKK